MDPEKEGSQIESAAEIEAEKEHLSEVKETEVRDRVIAEFGFDPETDKERIDKLVARETGYRKNLSKAVGQKVKYRTELQSTKKPSSTATESKHSVEDIDKIVNDRLEQRDLESLEYPDDIKKVIQSVSKINGVSVRAAATDPYVQAKIDTWRKQSGADKAALTRTNKSRSQDSAEDEMTPPDVDMTTEEGRKEYDKWKNGLIKKGY